jgi:hypothetical protein
MCQDEMCGSSYLLPLQQLKFRHVSSSSSVGHKKMMPKSHGTLFPPTYLFSHNT